ncbi:hypothetical protein MMJ63_24590, partial [Bacillus vallismortis]|nr:hypothetical protein [Bacillus vallismortis]
GGGGVGGWMGGAAGLKGEKLRNKGNRVKKDNKTKTEDARERKLKKKKKWKKKVICKFKKQDPNVYENIK